MEADKVNAYGITITHPHMAPIILAKMDVFVKEECDNEFFLAISKILWAKLIYIYWLARCTKVNTIPT